MPLTHTECNNFKGKEKLYRKSDGGGLYIQVMPIGSKYWRLKYRHLGKEKHLALGIFPDVSLLKARKRRDEARELIADGIDPSQDKKQKKQEAILNAANTFEAVALEWHEKKSHTWQPKTAQKILNTLERNAFPDLGKRPIAEIEPPELLATLRKIEERGAHYLAGRVKQYCGQIFRYGVATGKNPRDPSRDLTGALTPNKTTHYTTIDIKEVPPFLKALERNEARLFPQTRRGIYLLMLTFVRTSELIHATWDEIDLDKAIWEIPAERMKMGKPHIVPLSRQVLELFKEQKAETERLYTPYVFPNQVRPQTPMSNNTILMGLKRLGYRGKMTGHGFRALAMTTLMENLDYSHDIVDTQLAHAKGDNTRRAYDRTIYLPQRTAMMQRYADYIDTLAGHGEVIKAKFGGV